MVTTASHHICSLTIFISCAFKGIQQSWTSCARSMPVWWKSWQTATASCSRRSTRGSHWRSATSRTCPSWRYGHPDARPVFLGCTSSSPAETKKNVPSFMKPGSPVWLLMWLEGVVALEGKWEEVTVQILSGVVGNRTWDGRVCWFRKQECLRHCGVYKHSSW